VSEVRVFDRGDLNYWDCTPLVLELSSDGNNFQEIARLPQRFPALEPWSVNVDKRPTRFVRVHCLATGVLALREIEVYSRP
jgi:hypothetical protein